MQVDGGSGFIARFETACEEKGISLAMPPPKSLSAKRQSEQMQAACCCEFQKLKEETATQLSELNAVTVRQLELQNDYRPYGALDGMTPNKCLECWRNNETPNSQMYWAAGTLR